MVEGVGLTGLLLVHGNIREVSIAIVDELISVFGYFFGIKSHVDHYVAVGCLVLKSQL